MLEIAETTMKEMHKLQDPATQTKARSFLGLCNGFRQFVQTVSTLAAPLNKKTLEGSAKVLSRINEKRETVGKGPKNPEEPASTRALIANRQL